MSLIEDLIQKSNFWFSKNFFLRLFSFPMTVFENKKQEWNWKAHEIFPMNWAKSTRLLSDLKKIVNTPFHFLFAAPHFTTRRHLGGFELLIQKFFLKTSTEYLRLMFYKRESLEFVQILQKKHLI